MKQSVRPEVRDLAVRTEGRDTFFTYTGLSFPFPPQNCEDEKLETSRFFVVFYSHLSFLGTIPWEIEEGMFNNKSGAISVTTSFFETLIDDVYKRLG